MPLSTMLWLLLAALVLLAGSYLPLTAGSWRLRYPRTALSAAHTAFFGGIALLLLSLVGAILTAISAARDWQLWFEPTLMTGFSWLGLAVVGGLLSLVAAKIQPLTAADRRMQTEASVLAASCRSSRLRSADLVTVESELPLALSLPGQPGRVVIASRLHGELTEGQLRAVIEHELAHLDQRHGRINQLAQLKRICLPILPGSARLESSTALLLELIADDAAARRAGAVHTANALAKVGQLRRDDSMALRAHRIASRPPRGSMGKAWRLRSSLG